MIKNSYRLHGREPARCFQRTSQRAWRWLIKCFSSAASPKIMPQTSSLRFAPNSIRNCAGAWDAELGILSLTPSLQPSPAFGSSRRIDGGQLRRIALLLISREADGFGVPNFLKGKKYGRNRHGCADTRHSGARQGRAVPAVPAWPLQPAASHRHG